MKKLTLVRHSIACKSSQSIDDRTRYLTTEGIELIMQISTKVKNEFLKNSIFISSSAIRAYQTAIEFIVCSKAYDNVRLLIDSFLYELFNFNELVYNVLTKYEKHDNIWIFGHNPSLTNIATTLLNQHIFMKKCSIIHFEFNTSKWEDISNSNLINFYFIDSQID